MQPGAGEAENDVARLDRSAIDDVAAGVGAKRVARSYRYYLTRLGRAAIAAACRLTQTTIIPALA